MSCPNQESNILNFDIIFTQLILNGRVCGTWQTFHTETAQGQVRGKKEFKVSLVMLDPLTPHKVAAE